MANYKTGKIANKVTLETFGTSMANCGTFHSRRGQKFLRTWWEHLNF